MLQRLAQESGQAILFVSHRLDEIVTIARRVTVLRDGRNVATMDHHNVTRTALVEAIVGPGGADKVQVQHMVRVLLRLDRGGMAQFLLPAGAVSRWRRMKPVVLGAIALFFVLPLLALFGGAGAIGPALQSVGIGWGYHLFNIVPYVLTLLILVLTCRPGVVVPGSPGELSSTR